MFLARMLDCLEMEDVWTVLSAVVLATLVAKLSCGCTRRECSPGKFVEFLCVSAADNDGRITREEVMEEDVRGSLRDRRRNKCRREL
mmetsp:Transcript_72/g.199  ORF Transcript_72/g.199 Transcript_72/m.199 type:complete len:87 (+) Transcript_72:72-332(+)